MTLYFEDLPVGDRHEVGGYTVSEDEIVEFAEQFDPQPFHVDETAAEDSVFGESVASGPHTPSVRPPVRHAVRHPPGTASQIRAGLGWTPSGGTNRCIRAIRSASSSNATSTPTPRS